MFPWKFHIFSYFSWMVDVLQFHSCFIDVLFYILVMDSNLVMQLENEKDQRNNTTKEVNTSKETRKTKHTHTYPYIIDICRQHIVLKYNIDIQFYQTKPAA